MYTGPSNPNASVPLEKMEIIPQKDESFSVLYNPESYTQSRQSNFRPAQAFSAPTQVPQFLSAGLEVLTFRLFFDSMSAGSEVGADKKEFASNSSETSLKKWMDVRVYTRRVTDLMMVHEDLHMPQYVCLRWDSLIFYGYLVACRQEFVKFTESGMPVRAWLDCTFMEMSTATKAAPTVMNSPDTTKFHTVCQGESLWSMSAKAYGQPEQWRLIAAANGIANPRRLRSGEVLRMPALKK